MKDAAIDAVWRGPPRCRDCGIRHLVLFADLQEADFRLIHQPIVEQDIPAGETLYRSGDPPRYLYTVREGLVKLVQFQPNGGQRILRLLRQGDVAAMEALVATPCQHDAVALEPVSVCRIPVAVVERLSRDTPRLHRQLLTRWQRALSDADDWLTSFSAGPAPLRVARLLVYLGGSRADAVCYLPSREDIGAILGIAPETASRVTADLRRKGWIEEIDTRHVRLDLPALRDMARLEDDPAVRRE